MNEPRVYQSSPFVLIILLLFGAFVVGGLIYGVGFQSMAFTLPIWGLAFLLLVMVFLKAFSKVIISDDEFTTKSLLASKTLRWTEIVRVSGSGNRIKLHNRDGDVTLSPSSSLPKYQEIIEIIGTKRPDLFSPQEFGEMGRGWSSVLQHLFLVLIFGGVVLGFFVTYTSSQSATEVDLVTVAIFGIFLLVYLGSLFFAPKGFTLDGNVLTVKYLFNEKVFRADEITMVYFGFTQTRNGRNYYVAINHKKGNIRFASLSAGLPIGYLVLKNWHKSNTQGQFANQRPSLDNIAPNWSDNSGR